MGSRLCEAVRGTGGGERAGAANVLSDKGSRWASCAHSRAWSSTGRPSVSYRIAHVRQGLRTGVLMVIRAH